MQDGGTVPYTNTVPTTSCLAKDGNVISQWRYLLEEGTDRGGRFIVDVEVEDRGVVRFEEGKNGCEGRNASR